MPGFSASTDSTPRAGAARAKIRVRKVTQCHDAALQQGMPLYVAARRLPGNA